MTDADAILAACPVPWVRDAARAFVARIAEYIPELEASMKIQPEAKAMLYVAFLEGCRMTHNATMQALTDVFPIPESPEHRRSCRNPDCKGCAS